MSFLPPKKSLGQHFLHDPGICSRIVGKLGLRPGDQAIEIGPGPGCLTRHLAAAGLSNFLLLEKDPRFAFKGAASFPLASFLLIDALDFPWARLGSLGEWKIIGNLPYNIASPLIWDIVSQCDCWSRAVFMVQKEVALRLAAKPRSKDYGALSVWTQSFAVPSVEFYIAPGAFSPPPKVDSAVVSLLPGKRAPFKPASLKKLLDICFQNRRKQLGGVIRRLGLASLASGLEELSIDPASRPEEIAPAQFQALSGWLASERENHNSGSP